MRVVFAGSPAIAVPSLELLAREDEIKLAGVITNPDAPRGRDGTPQPTETGRAALKILQESGGRGRGFFPILKPVKLDAQAREDVAALNPDLLVSFAYGRFFGPKFLALFPLGGINIHPSLLPKYRGPTPIQAAILNRDSVTGITIQKLTQEIDSGDILAARQLQLTGRETTGSLSEIAGEQAALILPEALEKIKAGEKGVMQDRGGVSYCPLISKDDGIINWKAGALEIEAKIRAYDPWPLARTIHKGRDLFILKADVFKNEAGYPKGESGVVLGIDKQNGILVQTGDGILAVTHLQYSGKKALFWQDFINGARDFPGSILG